MVVRSEIHLALGGKIAEKLMLMIIYLLSSHDRNRLFTVYLSTPHRLTFHRGACASQFSGAAGFLYRLYSKYITFSFILLACLFFNILLFKAEHSV